MSQEIYQRLARMVEQATTRVKICVPSTDYYAGPDDYATDTIYVIDSSHLVSLLEDAAKEAAVEENDPSNSE